MIVIALLCLSLSLTLHAAEPLPIPNWKMVQSLDSDHSGSISQKEFLSSPKIFDLIDVNKDGLITREEVNAARKTTPVPPKAGEAAPSLKATDPKTGKAVSLAQRKKPFALIFGTHT